jgi:peptide chain release factor 1
MGLLTSRKDELEEKLKILLLPKDPNDEKDVIIELRAGTGGEEAALFTSDLLRMYLRYAEKKQWSTEILDSHPTDIGGFKEIVLSVKGRGECTASKGFLPPNQAGGFIPRPLR